MVEFVAFDDQVAAGIRSREAERAELAVRATQDRVAVGTRADVVRGVAHVRRVAVIDDPGTFRVGNEDPVLTARVREPVGVSRRRGYVVAPVAAHPDLAAPVAAVPPDLVPLAARRAGEVVARG